MENQIAKVSDSKIPMPTTFDVASLSSVLFYAGRLEKLEEQDVKVKGEPSVSVSPKQNKISFRGKSSRVAFFFNDTKNLSGKNRADAVFDYIMCRLAEAYQRKFIQPGEPVSVTFPLSDMVTDGIYKDMYSARKGFENAIKGLQSICVEESKHIKKEGRTQSFIRPIGSATIKNGLITVYMGELIKWEQEVKEFVNSPRNYFALDSKSYRGAKAIYRTIRTNLYTDWFKMSFKAIAVKSGIIIDYDHPKRTKTQIVKVLNILKSECFSTLAIKIVQTEVKDLDRWLSEGMAIIKPKGELADEIATIKKRRNAKLKT